MALKPVPGSVYRRNALGVRSITLRFIVPAGEVSDETALEQFDNLSPAAPLGLPEVSREGFKLGDGDWRLELKFEGIPPAAKSAG